MRRQKHRLDQTTSQLHLSTLIIDEVLAKYDEMMEWLSKLYVDTLNMIHYMHDKYYYEAAQMSLIDTDVRTYICYRYRRILTCSRFLKRYQIRKG